VITTIGTLMVNFFIITATKYITLIVLVGVIIWRLGAHFGKNHSTKCRLGLPEDHIASLNSE